MTLGENWPLAVPFGILAMLALGFGSHLLRRQIGLLRRGIVVDAVVVERTLHAGLPHPDDRIGSTVTPHFRYRLADDTEHAAQLDHQAVKRRRSEGWKLRYALGSQHRMRIDPTRPDIAYVNAPLSELVLPLLLVFAGVVTGLLSLGIAFG
jgi:hypothetical protein